MNCAPELCQPEHPLLKLLGLQSATEQSAEVGAVAAEREHDVSRIPGTPKSHEARSVPFPAFLAEPLAKQCEGKSRDQLVFGDGVDLTPTHPTLMDGSRVPERGQSDSTRTFRVR